MSTRRWARWWAIATGVLAVIATVSGWFGFEQYVVSGPTSGEHFERARFFDLLFYTFQLFVLGPAPFGAPPYGWLLSIASFLAPLTTVMAVVQAVSAASRSSWEAWRVRHAHGHDVVVGRTPEAFALAQVLAAPTGTPGTSAKSARKVVLLGTDITADVARRHDLHVVAGEAVDEEALHAAGVPGAARVFALDASGAANAAVALHVRSLHEHAQSICRLEGLRLGRWLLEKTPAPVTRLAGRTPPGTWLLAKPSKTRDIAVHARVEGAGLGAALRARRLGADSQHGFRVDFFSVQTVAARALLRQHPPGPDVVIVGTNDAFAEAVHQELVRRRYQAGAPVPGPIVPIENADKLAEPADSTYICGSDPDEVLRIGLTLLLAGHPHVVLCLGRRAALAGALEQRLFDGVDKLHVFGILDAACDPDRLTSSTLIEQLARALHGYYLRTYGADGQASNVPWDELDDSFKADNRAQADQIGEKLALIPAVIVPAAPGLPTFSLTADEVEELAEMEHVRWMNNKKGEGVVYGPKRVKNETHPDMLEWDDPRLTEETKDKDRGFVQELPRLLASEDLAILRRRSAEGDGATATSGQA